MELKLRRAASPTGRPERANNSEPEDARPGHDDPVLGRPDSLAGYLRRPEPPHTHAAPPPPVGGYMLLIAARSEPSAACAPRVIGRIALRGYTDQPAARVVPVRVDPPLPPGAHLRPIGRLAPLADAGAPPGLRAVRSGQAYRITSSIQRNLVAPALAQALEEAFERFAASCGLSSQAPIAIAFSRGYEDCDRGHGSGLAADIASVAGRGLREWKQDWEQAITRGTLADEAHRNLGLRLYRVLLHYGGWRVYNNVVQLFGPWTEQLGPWRRMRLERPTADQQQLLAEQERIFQVHQDHIHVAR
jgi:hypothetical protein